MQRAATAAGHLPHRNLEVPVGARFAHQRIRAHIVAALQLHAKIHMAADLEVARGGAGIEHDFAHARAGIGSADHAGAVPLGVFTHEGLQAMRRADLCRL